MVAILKNLKQLLYNHIPLKFFSLLLGYTLWSMISQSVPMTISLPVNLTFYNMPDNVITAAPETITVTLHGKRAFLQSLDLEHLAFHIDGTALHEGTNYIALQKQHLFLPEHINLLHYALAPLIVHTKYSMEQDKNV